MLEEAEFLLILFTPRLPNSSSLFAVDCDDLNAYNSARVFLFFAAQCFFFCVSQKPQQESVDIKDSFHK
jgi:hypothetical protein